jgi:hypothetical protein
MICAALNAIEARRAELNGNADSYDERVAGRTQFTKRSEARRTPVREKAST